MNKNKPKIYLVKGVDSEKPNPFEEYVYYANNEEERYEPYCIQCQHSFDINFLELFCYTKSMSCDYSDMTAFIEGDNDYMMMTYKEHAENIAQKLRGVVPSRIGFGENENQQFLESENWLTTKPFLSRLQVTGRCYNAFNSKGKNLEKCDHCNRIKGVVWATIEDTGCILLDSTQWDGTDVFRLHGTYNPIITENGVEVLNELGFDNLELEELHWF